jgi:hypothetical protein
MDADSSDNDYHRAMTSTNYERSLNQLSLTFRPRVDLDPNHALVLP